VSQPLRKAGLAFVLMMGVCECTLAQVAGYPDPLTLLASDDATLAANKRLVFDFWRGIVNAGHVELADELLAESYIQHSPVLPTGRAALKQVFSAVPRLEQIPDLVSPPLVALVAEGHYVVMALAESVAEPSGAGSYTTTHVNLFRVENGRLAEHWHSVQTAPGPNVPRPEDGGPQPVTGRVGIEQFALLEAAEPGLAANKRQVFDFWRQVADAGRAELVEVYVDPGFVGRSAIMAAGRSGFAAHFAARLERPIAVTLEDPLVAMVAEGDLVVQVRMRQHAHPSRAGDTYTTTLFDMFRLADGRLVEYWDALLKPSQAR
jgi:predicted SnoaL-like aldol condensation-catalyzing enzyme